MRFVLVHGGGHGAWCWDLLIPELERLGHEAVAMDLPGGGARRDELATLAGYRDAVLEVVQPGDVLVGHSMGGTPITMVADVFPEVGHLIYLASGLPVEGGTMAGDLGDASWDFEGAEAEVPAAPAAEPPEFVQFTSLDDTVALFFHDCPPDLAKWAFDRLTPQRNTVLTERISVPRFWTLDIPRSYIRGTEDRVIPVEWAERWARRLGVEMLTIPTSHSPFLSRPAELAELLVFAVGTKPIGPLLPDNSTL